MSFCESADFGELSVNTKWTVDSLVNGTTNPRTGARSMGLTNQFSKVTLSAPVAAISVGGAWILGTLGNQTIIRLLDSGTVQLDIRVANGNQDIQITRNGTVLATASGVISSSVYASIVLVATINNTTGSYAVYVDGVLQLTATGVDTQQTANAQVTDVEFGGLNGQLDDVWINDYDGTYWGDCAVHALGPDGNGTDQDMTPSAGTAYQTVDEVPPNNTDWVSASSAGQKSSFNVTSVPTTGTIRMLQAQAVVSKDEAGLVTARLYILVNGTRYYGPTVAISTSQMYLRHEWVLNPDTSAAWTIAEVNAVEVGVERVA